MQAIPANLENYRPEILEGQKALEKKRREFALSSPQNNKQQLQHTKNSPQEGLGRALQTVPDKNTGLEVPESLQKYKAEILAGLSAAGLRRIEYSKAWGYHRNQTIARLAGSNDTAGGPMEMVPAPIATCSDVITEKFVKFWPMMGISAWRQNKGGAWLAWTLAKYLDPSGRGAIREADLQSLARELGIHPKTWHRWMTNAKQCGFIRGLANGRILLAGYSSAARLLGCDYIGSRPTQIPIHELVGPCWRAHVWAAYEQTHLGRPISRLRQEALTGVPVSTQRAYDNAANVLRRSSISISTKSPDQLPGVIEFEGRPGAFELYDRRQHKLVIAWHLPDSRISGSAISLQRGRSRKINKALRHDDGSSILGRAPSCFANDVPAFRLFHKTMTQAKATERKLSRSDQTPPHEIYLLSPEGKKVDLWRPLPYDRFVSGLSVCA
jgi:hypothetical protein